MPNNRKILSSAQHTALTTQVDGVCPLDMEPLFYNKGQRSNKSYEIAHIYPLNPTPAEKTLLQYEERLGINLNDEDNLIPLCKLCHGKFDKPRTLDDYRTLIAIKKDIIERSGQRKLWKTHHIEKDILKIVDAIYSDAEDDEDLETNFSPVKIDEKLSDSISKPTRRKIKNNVRDYYTFIREQFTLLDKAGNCTSEIISTQIRTFYLIQKRQGVSQQAAFDNIANWLNAQIKPETIDAAEILASFFIQNCEIFE